MMEDLPSEFSTLLSITNPNFHKLDFGLVLLYGNNFIVESLFHLSNLFFIYNRKKLYHKRIGKLNIEKLS